MKHATLLHALSHAKTNTYSATSATKTYMLQGLEQTATHFPQIIQPLMTPNFLHQYHPSKPEQEWRTLEIRDI